MLKPGGKLVVIFDENLHKGVFLPLVPSVYAIASDLELTPHAHIYDYWPSFLQMSEREMTKCEQLKRLVNSMKHVIVWHVPLSTEQTTTVEEAIA